MNRLLPTRSDAEANNKRTGLFAPKSAGKPRPPALGPAAIEAQERKKQYFHDREQLERYSVLKGLLLLAIIVFFISLLRAGWDRAFFHGWWKQW
ncbi:MAG: hypothetical protein INR62_14345 [Rhodospirillales bacterium]|nr:hypothetical protein [Acetobacter sp.]